MISIKLFLKNLFLSFSSRNYEGLKADNQRLTRELEAMQKEMLRIGAK